MNIKDLSQEKINNLSIMQLYNLLYGPIIDNLNQVNNIKDNAVVAVYGATIIPLLRRVRTAANFVSNSESKNVILSGGYGWEGLPRRHRDPNLKDLLKRTRDRIDVIRQLLPTVTEISINQINKDLSSISSDIFEFVDNEYNRIKYDFDLDEYSLKGYIVDNLIDQYILHYMTEAELMKIIWDYNYFDIAADIILEDKSSITPDNAKNCLDIFKKLQEDNPKLDTLLIVSDWAHLERAILTTKKIANDQGININILGLPVSYDLDFSSIDELKNHHSNGLLKNINKLISYEEVDDYDISKYIDMNEYLDNGPLIRVRGKNIK